MKCILMAVTQIVMKLSVTRTEILLTHLARALTARSSWCLLRVGVVCLTWAQGHKSKVLILLAFITGNSSLEPLLEGLLVQIHIDMSSRIFCRNRTGDPRITQICQVPRSSPLSYGDGCITEDPSGPLQLFHWLMKAFKPIRLCYLADISRFNFSEQWRLGEGGWER